MYFNAGYNFYTVQYGVVRIVKSKKNEKLLIRGEYCKWMHIQGYSQQQQQFPWF